MDSSATLSDRSTAESWSVKTCIRRRYLTAGFKPEHPLQGTWADFDELQPAMNTDSVACMKNQVFVYKRTQVIDEVYDNKSMLEDWFCEHIQRAFICPLVSGKEKLLGVLLLLESVNSSGQTQSAPWLRHLSDADPIQEGKN